MPLLRRQPFLKHKPPSDLDPEEEVFHCKLTNEIFRDYEEFFERIILCNSLLWSCEITGKWGLTYQEAVENEEKARRNLATFPDYLQRPILYLATLTYRSRMAVMNDDVFVFAKDRYFIGEIVDVVHDGIRKPYKILKVLPPTEEEIQQHALNGDIDDAALDDSLGEKRIGVDPSLFTYKVQDTMNAELLMVTHVQISRKKGLYTRDKSKLFLKHNCYVVDGVWRVKESIVRSLKLNELKFESFFVGAKPHFDRTQVKLKKHTTFLNPNLSLVSQSASDSSFNDSLDRKNHFNKERKFFKEDANMSLEERDILRERMKLEKLAERNARREELKRRLDEEKEKRRVGREQERDRKREEKRIQAEYLKEWSRPRDDLECEDLQEMPDLLPVQSRIPQDDFADALMVLEFIHTFQSLLDVTDYFPSGVTLGVLEEALLGCDVNGPLADLLLMIIVALFYLQESEEEEDDPDVSKDFSEEISCSDRSMATLIKTAAITAQYPMKNHGTPLRNLQLDSFTLTEILRLHLVSSGARANASNVKFRYQQRGGYTSMDDAGLHLCKDDPELMLRLGQENIFDMKPGDKLKCLSVLVHQFLTYAACRELVEDNFEKLRQLKMDLKQLQWSELRREREEATARYKRSVEERLRERKLLELKITNEALKEAGVDVIKNGNADDKEADKSDKKASRSRLVQIDKFNKLEDLEKINEQELTPDEKDAYWQKREQLDAKKKAENLDKEKDLLVQMSKLQQGNAVYPLGRDRMYRRYWTFSALPGLFVEDNDETVPDELKPGYNKGKEEEETQEEKEVKKESVKDEEEVKEKKGVKKEKEEEEGVKSEEDKEGVKKEREEEGVKSEGEEKMEVDSDSKDSKKSVHGSDKSGSDKNGSDKKSTNGVIDLTDMTDDGSGEDDYDDDESEEEEDEEPPAYLEYESVKRIINRDRVKWTYIKSPEQFNRLLESLNSRGFREGNLRQILQENSARIQESIGNCPFEDPDDAAEEKPKKDKLKNGRKNTEELDTAHEVLETNLRDLIVDLEERIYVGGLGCMKEVTDRFEWREAVSSPTDTDASSKETVKKECPSSEVVVKTLAKALLQIAKGVESRYMLDPFGEAGGKDPKKNKKKEKEDKGEQSDEAENDETKTDVVASGSQKTKKGKSLFERWEESLTNCTSLPQIFIHLSTMEKSIIWSKSALHARCRICRRKGDGEHMLLCDGCDRGHHMYCLKPPVKTVPAGDWFCPNCKPKEVRPSPRKGRQVRIAESESEEEEEEEEEEAEAEEEEEDEEEEEEEENSEEEVEESEEESSPDSHACVVCGRRGALVTCDKCPNVYHLSCANPPLKKVPKTKWLCKNCTGDNKKSKKSSSTKSPAGSSSQPGSRRESPVNARSKKRAKSESDEETPKRSRSAGKSKTTPPPPAPIIDEDSDVKHYISSYRGNDKVAQLKACEKIVNDLMAHEDSWPFLRPVNKKMVPDYYEIIKIPMDFSTIRNRIHKYQYTETVSLLRDVRLIFSNCKEYNKKSAPEYKAGLQLSAYFENKSKEMQLEDEGSSPPSSSSGGGGRDSSGKSAKKKSRTQ